MDSESLLIAIETRLSGRSQLEMCHYLSLLTYYLTETVRGFFIFESTDSESLDLKLRAINEIQHRISSRLMRVVSSTDEWTEKDFVLTLMSFAQPAGCWPEVRKALEETISNLRFGNESAKNEDGVTDPSLDVL